MPSVTAVISRTYKSMVGHGSIDFEHRPTSDLCLSQTDMRT